MVIQFTFVAKETDERLRAQLKEQHRNNAYNTDGQHNGAIGFFDPAIVSCTKVIAHDGLTAHADAHGKGDDDGEYLHDDTYRGQRDVRAVDGIGAVAVDHVVGHRHDDNDRQLNNEAAYAQPG